MKTWNRTERTLVHMSMKYLAWTIVASILAGCTGRALDAPTVMSLVTRCQGCHESEPASNQLPMTGNNADDMQVAISKRDRVRQYLAGGHGGVPADELQEWLELLDQDN